MDFSMVLTRSQYENISKEEVIQDHTDGQIQMLQAKKLLCINTKI